MSAKDTVEMLVISESALDGDTGERNIFSTHQFHGLRKPGAGQLFCHGGAELASEVILQCLARYTHVADKFGDAHWPSIVGPYISQSPGHAGMESMGNVG